MSLTKTDKKAKTISQIIEELQGWQKELGDVEVVIANMEEAVFEGVGKTFAMKAADSDENFLGILRSDIVIRVPGIK